MRIAMVSDQHWPVTSGVSVAIDLLTRELTHRGHDVGLFVPHYPPSPTLPVRNAPGYVHVARFPGTAYLANNLNRIVDPWLRSRVERALHAFRPDVIHVHTEWTMGDFATRFAARAEVPLVFTIHTNWEGMIESYVPAAVARVARRYCRFRLGRMYAKADALIAPTAAMSTLPARYG